MRRLLIVIGSFLILFGCTTNPKLQEAGIIDTVIINGRTITIEYCLVPFLENNKTIFLEALLYRDMSLKTWPGIVMTHGRNGPHPTRNKKEVYNYYSINMKMAEKGCAVLFLVRRGYGNSQGNDSEFLDTPEESGIAAGLDLKAGTIFLRNIDGIEKNSLKIFGHSQGGWAALGAACEEIEGVKTVVNLCGGTNYKKMGSGAITEKVQADWIIGAGELGKINKIPTIWIYSENDRNHPPEKVKLAFNEYLKNGGIGQLHILPPYKENGHMIVASPELFLDLVL